MELDAHTWCVGSTHGRAVNGIFQKSASEIGLGGMLILNNASKIAEINESDP